MFPDINFSIQSATIPSVTFGVAEFDNPQQILNFPGDKLTYSPLPIKMMVDEEMVAYTELYGWMRNLAFPVNVPDLADTYQARAQTPVAYNAIQVCDITLTVLNSNNNPTVNFTFVDAFPIQIGDLRFDTTEEGNTYMYCDIEFAYNWFTVRKAT